MEIKKEEWIKHSERGFQSMLRVTAEDAKRALQCVKQFKEVRGLLVKLDIERLKLMYQKRYNL